MKIPFVGQSYLVRSKNLAAQRCVNFYVERSEVNPEEMALYGTPGTRRVVTMPNTGGIRQIYVPATGKAIVVQGDKIYRLANNYTYTECHGLPLRTNGGYVSIADNGTTAILVDGRNGYQLDLNTNIYSRIDNEAFYGADRVGFIDGYFIFNKPDSQQFYISGLYSTTFDGLDFASAEGSPDLLVSLLVDHREVWMFGESTTEVFYNSGNPDFPIERISGAFLEHGCAARHSVAKLDNTVFWLGKDNNGFGTVWRANGYTPQRVSTHAIEYAFQSYSQISDAIAYTYQADGHAFYVITFPQAGKTWCYDVAVGAWHERSYRDPTTGDDGRHRSSCLAFYGGKHLVGDYDDGRIYHLDPDYFTDDGDPLISTRAAPVVSNNGKRLFFSALQVDVEEGVGLSNIITTSDFDADAAEIISRTGGLDFPVYIAINNAVVSLKSAGIWDILDSFYMYATSNIASALIDWKRPTKTGTQVSLAGFTANQGVFGNGNSASYIGTDYTPSTDAVFYTQSSSAMFCYTPTTSQGQPNYLFGTGTIDAEETRLMTTTGGAMAVYVDGWYKYTAPSASGAGLWVVNRPGAGTFALYKDNLEISLSGGGAIGSLVSRPLRVADSANATLPVVSCWGASGSLDATMRADLQSIIEDYMAAL